MVQVLKGNYLIPSFDNLPFLEFHKDVIKELLMHLIMHVTELLIEVSLVTKLYEGNSCTLLLVRAMLITHRREASQAGLCLFLLADFHPPVTVICAVCCCV